MKRLTIALSILLVAAGTFLPARDAAAVTFRWANDGDAVSLDPYAIQEGFTMAFNANIYDTLLTRDRDLQVRPGLASAWRVVDAKTWEVTLRGGVKFHDGTDCTAEDVVFSFHRAVSKGSRFQGAFSNIASLTVSGERTLVVKSKAPDAVLPAMLSIVYVMSKRWAEANNAVEVASLRDRKENFATRHANGTGPFMLVSREADTKTVLRRNLHWWGWNEPGLASSNVDEVVFTPIKQDGTRVAALLSGQTDMLFNAPPQDVDRLRAAGIKVYQSPEMRTVYIGMDQHRDELLESDVKGRNPLKDRRVRLALYQAIDEDAIVSKIMRGAATPATLMVHPRVNGFDPNARRLGYNPDAARRLLVEAGYPNGFSVGFDCPNDRLLNDERICQAIAAMWAKIGVNAKLLAQSKSLFFPKIQSRQTSIYLNSWLPGTVDALEVLDLLLVSPNGAGGVGQANFGGYSNPELDALAQRARTEVDAAKRTALLRQALNLAEEDVATIPLHSQHMTWASAANVDLVQTPMNWFYLPWVRVK